MKDCRGLCLLVTLFAAVALLNCQWVVSAGAWPDEIADVRMWCMTFSAALVLFCPYVLTGKMWPSLIGVTFVYLVMLANLLYLRTFGSWIPVGSYLLAGNLADFGDSVTDSLEWVDFVVPLVVFAGASVSYCCRVAKPLRLRYWLVLVISLAATATSFAYPESMAQELEMLRTNHNRHAIAVSHYSLPVVLLHEALSSPRLDDVGMASVKKALDRRVKCFDGKKNLVVVFMESFECWPVGLDVGGKAVTPVIDSLVRDTTCRAFAVRPQTGAGRSIDAQLLVLCGLLPPHDEVFSFRYPGNNYPTIYKGLKRKNNYKVFSFTTDTKMIYNCGRISERFGVDSVYTLRKRAHGRKKRLDDAPFFAAAIRMIETDSLWPRNEPRALQFVTYSGHVPFDVPEDWTDTITVPPDWPDGLARYVNVIHYSDYALGLLIDYLKSRPDFGQTLVAIVGDHEAFGVERRTAYSRYLPAMAEVRVPLLLFNSSGRVGKAFPDTLVDQVDAYTMLVREMGLHGYDWHGVGGGSLGTEEEARKVSELILSYNLYSSDKDIKNK